MIDASIEVIIAGTVLAGFCALLITGAVKVADLRPSVLLTAFRKGSDGGEKEKADAEEREAPPTLEPTSHGLDVSGMFGTLASSIRDAITHIRTPDAEKKREIEQIDTMLNQTVGASAPSKGVESSIDPFSALEDLDFDSLEDLDLDSETAPKQEFGPDAFSPPPGIETSAVSDILDAHQSELVEIDIDQPEDSEISASLLGPSDIGSLGADLSELNTLDLDGIEIEVEGEGEDIEIDLDEPVLDEDHPDDLIEQPEEEGFDMVSFATGGMVDDDLIAALKTDFKKKAFVEDTSLVRELKGKKYDARDLARELEDVLAMLK